MFSSTIGVKAQKIKLNIDTYINQRKKQTVVSQPVPSVRRPEPSISVPPILPSQTSNAQNNIIANSPSMTISNPQSKLTQLQLKQMTFQGKIHDKQPLTVKNISKQKSINVFYIEEQQRYKIQMKAAQNNLELKINQELNTVDIYFKKGIKYKFYKPETGEPKWMLATDLKDQKVSLMTNKDGKALKAYFDAIVPEEHIKLDSQDGKMEEKQPNGQIIQRQQGVQSDDIIKFIVPNTQQLVDTQKLRKAIKDMKQEEKVMIIMDIFKIKKQYDDNLSIDRKKLKCPIHSCQKTYREISQLKTHLKKHPQLNKHGIELTQFGTFEYSSKALDLVLFLGKFCPFQLKKIIKKMKVKQIAQ